MSDLLETRKIRTRPFPNCLLCGREGRWAYRDQSDRLFGAPGHWNFRQCANRDCGLIWLDPMPVTDDLAKAYAHYYTHARPAANARNGMAKSVYLDLKRRYISG